MPTRSLSSNPSDFLDVYVMLTEFLRCNSTVIFTSARQLRARANLTLKVDTVSTVVA